MSRKAYGRPEQALSYEQYRRHGAYFLQGLLELDASSIEKARGRALQWQQWEVKNISANQVLAETSLQ
jgi:hypothetical protein